MAHDEASRLKAITQHEEPFFFFRMIGIVEQARILIEKDGLSFLKRDAMFE
jgi:hypothetical protein